MAGVSLHALGLEQRLADSVANPDAVRPWADVEAEALARAKR